VNEVWGTYVTFWFFVWAITMIGFAIGVWRIVAALERIAERGPRGE
jgi:hypothetical protein